MPSFTIKTSKTLADYVYPMTEDLATLLWKTCFERANMVASMAIRYTVENRETGKQHKSATRVTLCGDDDDQIVICYIEEYHPRKDGKADIEVNRYEYVVMD
jgi:hypothetical protein